MKFFFGFAGIPRPLLEDIQRENRRFAENAEYFIEHMPQNVPYAQRNVDACRKRYFKHAASLTGDAITNTGFALIYLVKDDDSTEYFRDQFFPHLLCVPVHWVMDASAGKSGIGASKNLLIDRLAQATTKARDALRVLRDELISRASKTPLLLPVQNFSSDQLVPTLRNLHADFSAAQVGPEQSIQTRVAEFRDHHPYNRQAGCFVDAASIEFRPPGKNRHGYARAGGDHPMTCLLNGRHRLGAPYDPMFHYDCIRGRGNLLADFCSCHSGQSAWEGNPHINVAPNDHVRVSRHK